MSREEINFFELRKRIEELVSCNAFEVHIQDEKTILIPYMMSDAIEYLFVLTDAKVIGAPVIYDDDLEHKDLVSFAVEGNRYGILLQQETGNRVSIWFTKAETSITCYQYHRIGHFWREGEEEYRRLVYILGTIRDKLEYAGETFGNETEEELRELMEFAPLRSYSPIRESLDEWYYSTVEGTDAMLRIAEEAGAKRYCRELRRYRFLQRKGIKVAFLERKLARDLRKNAQKGIYDVLNRKICEASKDWYTRTYRKEVSEYMETEYERVLAELAQAGYSKVTSEEWELPVFRKGDERLYLLEELPFTLSELEFDNFSYKLYGLVFSGIGFEHVYVKRFL